MKPQSILHTVFFILLTLIFVRPALAHPNRKPFPPFRIADNLYYVGDDYQADYLIVTPRGNILINTGYASELPGVKASIKKLGFNYRDTKILLISHAHGDHEGGAALVKKETGAKYMVMDADVSVVESGGKTDFRYGSDATARYQPAKVDRVLHDGDTVRLGGTVLVAHLTPGHTKGCTTWTMTVMDNGKKRNVVIVGGPYVNPDYVLVNNANYPTIAADFEKTFKVLKSLPCDIFLGAHGMYFNLDKKYALMMSGKKDAFVDPEGYQQFVAKKEQDFRKDLMQQRIPRTSRGTT